MVLSSEPSLQEGGREGGRENDGWLEGKGEKRKGGGYEIGQYFFLRCRQEVLGKSLAWSSASQVDHHIEIQTER